MRRCPTMKARIWMPRQIDCGARFLAENAIMARASSMNRRYPPEVEDRRSTTRNDKQQPVMEAKEDGTSTTIFLTLKVEPSRVLWNSLRPLLFETSLSVSRRALFWILSECFRNDTASLFITHNRQGSIPPLNHKTTTTNDAGANQTFSVDHRASMTELLDIQQRVINRIPRPNKSHFRGTTGNGNDKSPVVLVLWIQPPHAVPLEYLFASLLIRWEHRLIQAQSLAGYMATLGGGFFLCHHFATAMFLANQQQRLAVLLNDETMYYSCAIHKAYSCIYSGRFRLARQLLRQVLRIVTGRKHQSNEVIERMCRSALLFGKRMRRQSQLLTTTSSSRRIDTDTVGSIQGLEHEQGGSSTGAVNESSNPSTQVQPPTFDDFVRVRVIRDKSKKDDLVIPFSKACGG